METQEVTLIFHLYFSRETAQLLLGNPWWFLMDAALGTLRERNILIGFVFQLKNSLFLC